MLSEKGSINDTPVIKLLLTIFEQSLTGILYMKSDEIVKVLYFSRGKLTWAISNSDEDKLENILLNKKKIDPEVIKKIKKEAGVSDSIGKLLVEQGLITLEELIESSKAQLKRIINSILKWRYGSFHFVKDSPPERLLSLDLNITDFIMHFILEEVELSEIWKSIGSLQVEFIKNPDEEKITRYHLRPKQLQLLDGFTGDVKLEAVLSRYSGGHRESLLKLIYFFLLSQLLIKKEFELSDSTAFDDTERFHFSEEEPSQTIFDTGARDTAPRDQKPDPVPSPGEPGYVLGNILHKKPTLEKPTTGEPPQPPPVPKEVKDKYEPSKDLPATSRFQAAPAGKDGDPRKIKTLNLVLVIIIFVLGGVIFLLISGFLQESPIDELIKQENAKGNDIISFEEPGPGEKPPAGDDAKTGQTGKDGNGGEPPTENPSGTPTLKPPDQKAGKKNDNKTEQKAGTKDKKPVTETKPPKTLPEAKKEDPKPRTVPGKSAASYFHEGSFITAGDVWKQELKKSGIKYAFLLELDCMKESVNNAYKQFKDTSAFFILNKKSGRRNCFLVMWGKFRTEKEAAKFVKKIPLYFWKQKPPPSVVPISKYL